MLSEPSAVPSQDMTRRLTTSVAEPLGSFMENSMTEKMAELRVAYFKGLIVSEEFAAKTLDFVQAELSQSKNTGFDEAEQIMRDLQFHLQQMFGVIK